MIMNRAMAVLFSILALGGCAVGIERTPGMKLYADGNIAAAVPILQAEVAAGKIPARYSLGLAYRDGVGVEKDPAKAEILLTGAALGGDPRAVAAIRAMLAAENRCPLDKRLHNDWGDIGLGQRNLVTGVVELDSAPVRVLLRMASIYEAPCPGRPVQAEAARTLRSLSSGPRHIWIYIPG